MMKVTLALFVLATCGISRAENLDFLSPALVQEVQNTMSAQLERSTLDLINWKIGDNMVYDVELGSMGKLGSMTMAASKDEGAAVWVKEEANLMGQNDVTEILINRADGKVLKMIHNGQEQQVPNQDIEIISQDYTSVTVPAGTFKCMHVVAKSKDVSKMEIWANPQATALMGMVQQSMDSQMGTVTLKLTSFKKN